MSRCSRMLTASFVAIMAGFGVIAVRAQVTPPADMSSAEQARFDQLDKIDGELLAHQQEKVRPLGRTPEEHAARLRYLGLKAGNLDGEDCALYVRQRLTAERIEELKQRGIVVNPWLWVPPVPGKHPFGFHLAQVSYVSLDVVRNDPRIVRLKSTEFADQPDNDLGGIMINVDDVPNGNGVIPRDGTGVKIAIADSGMDLTHPDLPAPVEAYDMTDGTGPGSWGTDVSSVTSAHGTHVTGTAVGSGGLSAGRYVGAAPGASLYFYKITDDTGSTSTTDEIEAINRAVVVGCDVFSMSFSGYRTWMDGTDPVDQAVDAAFAAGVVCFLSAGNVADDDQHDSISVGPGTISPAFGLTIDNTSSGSAYTSDQWIRVIWIDDLPSDWNMVLACSNLAGGESLVQAYQGTSPRNTEAKRYVLTPNVGAGVSRTYNLTLQNTAGSGSTPLVHCYVTAGKATFDSADPYYTVRSPAHADDAIAVGAWTQRRSWTDYQGNNWYYSFLTVGTLAPFSSRGPRVDGVMKPNIVAPGAVTISSRDATQGLADVDQFIIDNDGLNLNGSGPANYYINYGTSMATPLAAGAAALLLEAFPSLTAADVRDALLSTASMAGSPNHDVGHGLIDILAAINSVSDCNGNQIPDECDIDCGLAGCDVPGCGESGNCNENGVPDECDLTSGTSQDCNENDIPDECEYAKGDMNCDHLINFADINAFVVALQGPDTYFMYYPACVWLNGDFTGDNLVNFADINPFVAALGGSGQCP